jgi:sortase B
MKETRMKLLKEIFVFACIVAVAASAFYIGKYFYTVDTEENVYRHTVPPPVSDESVNSETAGWLDGLRKENLDVAGWLRVTGTKIDYPVMQAEADEPEFYLHHNIKRKYALSGALFAAENCDMERPSDNVVIFGHHMKAGTMFGALKRFESKDFAVKPDRIHLYTVRGWERYDVVAVYKVSVSDGQKPPFNYHGIADFRDETEFSEYMTNVEKHKLFDTGVTAIFGDKLLSLSTCEYSRRDGRLVVVAKRISLV